MRLACQTQVAGDVRVFVPEESRRTAQVVRKEAGDRTVPLDPAVKRLPSRATAADPGRCGRGRRAVADGPRARLMGCRVSSSTSRCCRPCPARCARPAGMYRCSCGRARSIIGVRPATEAGRVLGLAVDVGTTTIAAYLVDLQTGEVLATESAMNPQVAFGDDVIARLHYVIHDAAGLGELQTDSDHRGDRPGREGCRAERGGLDRHLRRGHGGQHGHAPPVPRTRHSRARRGALRSRRPGAGRHPGLGDRPDLPPAAAVCTCCRWRPASSAPTTWACSSPRSPTSRTRSC